MAEGMKSRGNTKYLPALFTTDRHLWYNMPPSRQRIIFSMETPIPQVEVDLLLAKVKAAMKKSGVAADDTIDGTRLVVIHPENWEVSLLVPYKDTKAAVVRKGVEKILFDLCGVERNCCDYFGRQTPKKDYEWYFRHPNVPRETYERLELEIEAELGDEVGMGLPTPGKIKSKSNVAFLSLAGQYFDAIAKGEKTTEYRMLNQYYCDKFFSPGVEKKFVKFNRGYKPGPENQMTFEIRDIVLVSERYEEIPVRDSNGKLRTSYSQIPRNFAPAKYGIKLGRRIS